MTALVSGFSFQLPDWVAAFMARQPAQFQTQDARMQLVIGLAREHVLRGTGGPFAAAVFDSTGRVLAVGVNLSKPATVRCYMPSWWHWRWPSSPSVATISVPRATVLVSWSVPLNRVPCVWGPFPGPPLQACSVVPVMRMRVPSVSMKALIQELNG